MTEALYVGDCIKLLPQLDLEVDLLCADPPYNIAGVATVISRKGRFKGPDINPVFDFDHDIIQPEDWIPVAVECLKEDAVFISFLSAQQVGRTMNLLEKLKLKVRHLSAWVKTNPVPQTGKKKWSSGLEYFIVATRGDNYHYNWLEGEHPNYIVAPICQGKERKGHPCQKPLAVMEDIVRWWSLPGDIVLDPFMGVGPTGVVARKLRRDFVGIDIKGEYVKTAAEWLNRVRPLPAESLMRTRPKQVKLNEFSAGF